MNAFEKQTNKKHSRQVSNDHPKNEKMVKRKTRKTNFFFWPSSIAAISISHIKTKTTSKRKQNDYTNIVLNVMQCSKM